MLPWTCSPSTRFCYKFLLQVSHDFWWRPSNGDGKGQLSFGDFAYFTVLLGFGDIAVTSRTLQHTCSSWNSAWEIRTSSPSFKNCLQGYSNHSNSFSKRPVQQLWIVTQWPLSSQRGMEDKMEVEEWHFHKLDAEMLCQWNAILGSVSSLIWKCACRILRVCQVWRHWYIYVGPPWQQATSCNL